MFYDPVVKITFNWVLNISGWVLVRLGGGVKKNRLAKNKQKREFKKIQKLIQADKKMYRCYATFVSSDKLLNFLKGHFFLFFTKDLVFFT